MCSCIECIGDQPEPYSVQLDNKLWHIAYKGIPLTRDLKTEKEAWEELDRMSNENKY